MEEANKQTNYSNAIMNTSYIHESKFIRKYCKFNLKYKYFTSLHEDAHDSFSYKFGFSFQTPSQLTKLLMPLALENSR